MANVRAIPEGYHTITPFLNLKDAHKAIEFFKKALAAEEKMRLPGPDGKIMHAEIKIGDSVVMLSEAAQTAPMPAMLFLYVSDCDAAFRRAVAAGATPKMPPADMFWGDRFARVSDPFGNDWSFATHQEDVPPEEMGKRAAAAMKAG